LRWSRVTHVCFKVKLKLTLFYFYNLYSLTLSFILNPALNVAHMKKQKRTDKAQKTQIRRRPTKTSTRIYTNYG